MIRKYFQAQNIEWALRIYVAFFISIYGVGKIIKGQFRVSPETLEQAVGELTGFELTWVFFGYSYAFAVIIGLMQILGGILLLIPRTRLIGALMLIPILVNIILIDIFYGIPLGALANAIFYFCCLLGILYINRDSLIQAFMTLLQTSCDAYRQVIFVRVLFIVIGLAILLFLNHVLGYFLDLVF